MVRYSGGDEGSVLTGLAEGTHYFRIRAVDAEGLPGAWSQPLEARVVFMDRHHLGRFLGLGGLVVILTVGTILHGHFRARSRN